MTFLIHAFDHTDADALNRRLAARETHLNAAKAMHERGEVLLAGAMLNPENQMMGSVVIVEMDSLEAVENWLRNEVYIQQNVWDKVQIYPMKIALR
ncbi:MAG: hypothetical protein JJU41_10200 [Bacteroidetes bacterium]|nr:hypothetical protein [Bacteroidota bacterium]MCH8524341.1 YciI family protein [Balneolales bacterium]